MSRGDDGTALEELRQCEQELEAYARERGLTVRLDPAYPGAPPPEEQPGPVKHSIWSLIGRMPGGSIGKLRHQATFGQVAGMNARSGHTVFIGRQPETVAYIPLLSVRPDEFGAELFAWAGDRRPRQEQTFESLELDRRFVVEVAKGQDQVWLYRLFSPTLIDWLAHETPPDFGFRLSSGSFSCEVPQWRGQSRSDGRVDVEHLDLVAACGGRVSGRIRDEVLEQVGLGKVPDPRSAEANRAWTNGRRSGRLMGFLNRIAGGGTDDSASRFAAGLGFTPVDPAAFHAARIMLPLPAAATDAFEGSLVDGRPAHLVWMEYESEYYGIRYYVGVTTALEREGPAVWFDADEVVAAAAEPGDLPVAALGLARDAGLGISTGGGFAAIYVSSTGWEGRPGKEQVRSMLDSAPRVFDALDADAAGVAGAARE